MVTYSQNDAVLMGKPRLMQFYIFGNNCSAQTLEGIMCTGVNVTEIIYLTHMIKK